MNNVLKINGYELHIQNSEPMIKDLDLAERLGFNRPRKIRELIKRMLDSDTLNQKLVCPTAGQTPGGGRPSTVYYLSEKAALKVITKSETAKADQITDEMIDVFIEYRRGAESQFSLPNFANPAEAAKAWAKQYEEKMKSEEERLKLQAVNDELHEKIEHDKPDVEFAHQVKVSHDSISVAEAAKIIGTGRNRLLAFMRQNRWVTRSNQPYQEKIDSGLLDVKIGKWEHPTQGLRETITTQVTGKGLAKLQKQWTLKAVS